MLHRSLDSKAHPGPWVIGTLDGVVCCFVLADPKVYFASSVRRQSLGIPLRLLLVEIIFLVNSCQLSLYRYHSFLERESRLFHVTTVIARTIPPDQKSV